MILYNTLMGICAALILLISADVLKKFHLGSSLTGHGAALLVTGIPLTILSLTMAITWPLNVNPPINIAFAEPNVLLGSLAIIGGVGLIRGYQLRPDFHLQPILWTISGVGLVLTAISAAIFRFNLVGDAPAAEPITGQIHGWENTTFGIIYLLAAIGCLLTPLVENFWAYKLVRISWITTGVFFLLFSALNYYTHIGLLTNLGTGSNYQW
jgi:Protein of unknown function (DUF981)